MLENLKEKVSIANKKLVKLGLVVLTFGNLSAIDKSRNYVAIKPSGVGYGCLKKEDISILDFKNNLIEGKKPSSDTLSHLELYRNFEGIKSIVHTHSTYATTFAQAKMPLFCLGTTHADYFHGKVPITREMTIEEVKENYELNTGKLIVETFTEKNINPLEIQAYLVSSHGPFVWGESIEKVLENSYILEEIAKMNFRALTLNPKISPIPQYLLDKHYFRKHGKNAYYGQGELE